MLDQILDVVGFVLIIATAVVVLVMLVAVVMCVVVEAAGEVLDFVDKHVRSEE